MANGTVALELALNALGIGEGDEVIVTPRTFLASVSSIVLRGARPVFADVDRDSGNIIPETARQVINKKTRAIMPVHLAGWPCDMQGFRALADEFGLYLIEDCAQAHGAAVDGRSVGSFGDAAAFSFCTDKIMSTGGEGGMVITRDRDLRHRMWEYKDHGKSWDAVYNRDHSPGFKWLHESFGTNWRLTEMQSAIGRVQLQKLPEWVQKSRDNAQVLIDGLTGVQGLRVPVPEDHVSPSWYKFYAYVREERLRPGWDRDAIVQAVIDNGVPCMYGICCPEVYLEKAFDRRRLRPGKRLPAAKELGETSLIFLVHPTLGQREMEETVRVVREVVGEG